MKYDAFLQDNGYQGSYDADYIGTFDTEEEAMEAAQYAYNMLWDVDKKKCEPIAVEHYDLEDQELC